MKIINPCAKIKLEWAEYFYGFAHDDQNKWPDKLMYTYKDAIQKSLDEIVTLTKS